MGGHDISDVLVGCGLAQVPDPDTNDSNGTGVPLLPCREAARWFGLTSTAAIASCVAAGALLLGGPTGAAIAAIAIAFAAAGAGRAGWRHMRRVGQLGTPPPDGWYEVQPDRAAAAATLLAGAPLVLPFMIFMSIEGVLPALVTGALAAICRLGYLAGYWVVTARSAAALHRAGRGRAMMPLAPAGARVVYAAVDDAG